MRVWGLSINAITSAVDVLVPAVDGGEALGSRYEEMDRFGTTVRIWKALSDGTAFDEAPLRWGDDYERFCLDPERELEEMPHSPDFRFMLEMRARLAEVLYFDWMDDAELALFRKYVRGD